MEISQGVELVVSAILFVLPAYIANMTPLILAKFLPKRRPIDMGKCLPDGRRILGNSKSIEGFIAGVIAGILTGLGLGDVLRGLLMGLGAMTGDVLGSFIKRRMGLEEGKPAPILDQYLFIIMALAFSYSVGIAPTLNQLIVILIATPILHVLSNYIAYVLGIKAYPF